MRFTFPSVNHAERTHSCCEMIIPFSQTWKPIELSWSSQPVFSCVVPHLTLQLFSSRLLSPSCDFVESDRPHHDFQTCHPARDLNRALSAGRLVLHASSISGWLEPIKSVHESRMYVLCCCAENVCTTNMSVKMSVHVTAFCAVEKFMIIS